MRICLALEWWSHAGIEVFTADLANRLAKNHEVTVIIDLRSDHVGEQDFDEAVNVMRVPNADVAAVVPSVIHALKPDVVHSQNVGDIGEACLKSATTRDVPCIYTAHQIPLNVTTQVEGRTTDWDEAWPGYISFARNVDYVVAPSPTVAHQLKAHSIEADVISCGVDTDRFTADNKIKARIGLRLPIRKTALFVGRNGEDKNLRTLLKAVSLVKELSLVIVGVEESELADIIEQHKIGDRVLVRGRIDHSSDQLVEYYRAADALVIPSLYETQSVVTLEAMSSSLPILASNADALPDLVDSDNGWLFDPRNLDQLVVALKAFVDCDASELAHKGKISRQKALTHSSEKAAKQYEELYRNACQH